MNNRYVIEVRDPLLRPGLCIRTEVSEKHLLLAVGKLMVLVQEINAPAEPNAGPIVDSLRSQGFCS